MAYTAKQEEQKLRAAMTTYRVLVYLALVCVLLSCFVTGLWNLVAELFLLVGLLWHYSYRKHYLKQSYEFQTRPQIVALLITVGLITQAVALHQLAFPFIPPNAQHINLGEFIIDIKGNHVQNVWVRDLRLVGTYTGREGTSSFTLLIPSRKEFPQLYDFMLNRGVNVSVEPSVATIFPAPPEYFQFVLVLQAVAFILFMVALVLFKQFRVLQAANFDAKRVRVKFPDNRTGSIDAEDFDPATMEEI